LLPAADLELHRSSVNRDPAVDDLAALIEAMVEERRNVALGVAA